MIEIVFWSGVFVVSLIVLVKSSDFFTVAAEKLGLVAGLSPFIIGVTIVAMGTSLPELISGVIAVLNNNSEILVGNVIGSNITNIFLVLGVAAVISKSTIRITREIMNVDLPLFITSAFLFAFTILDGKFSQVDGFITLTAGVLYIFYTVFSSSEIEDPKREKEVTESVKQIRITRTIGTNIFIIILSGFFIYLGANYTVESIIVLSDIFQIAPSAIALTAVALGTSLPEIAVIISAARNNQAEMALGNVLGSNVFNAYFVMGIPSIIGSIEVPEEILFFSLPLMIAATLLFVFYTQDKQMSKWEGWMLIIFYFFYIGSIFNIL